MLLTRRLLASALASLTLLATALTPASAANQPAPAAVTPLPPVSTDDPRFGIVQAYENPRLAMNAGAKWERAPFFWNKAQPSGPSDWLPDQFEMTSAQLQKELADGMQVVGQIGNPPDWATKDGSTPKNLDQPWQSPDNYWAQFVYKLAQTYAGKIDTWVLWNEPDFPRGDPLSTWAGTESDYYLLLKDGYQAIKAANPNATIVFAGTTYWIDVNAGRTLFFQRVLEAAKRMDPSAAANGYYFDAVDIHLYGSPLDVYRIPKAYQDVMAGFGISKPIWISEMNVPPYDDPGNEVPAGQLRASLQEQANYVIRSMAMAIAAGVQKVAVYKMVDDGIIDKMPWGLARNDGTLRPEYVAYQVAVSHFSDPGTVSYWNSAGVDVGSFDRGDNRTWVLINPAPTATVASVPWMGTNATITTKLGVSTSQTFPGLTNGQPPQLSVNLAGATNGVIGGDPFIIDQTNIGGFITISPEQIFFPVSGHSVANGILDYWRANGGLKHFGPPTGDETLKPDRVMQTFGNSTIEVFPAFNGTDFYVQEGTGKVYPTNPVGPAGGGAQIFPETGHNVSFAFLKAFKADGGLDVIGYPRTEAMNYLGQTMQFFQRAVMVYHPELAGKAGEVELRNLGADATKGRTFPDGTPGPNTPASQFYSQTNHTVANAFLKFFKDHGGPDILGYPISDAMPDQLSDGSIHTVQYFQRARMEYHPELAGKSGEVSLGLLGDELLHQMGWLP